METYGIAEAADRAGVSVDELGQLVELRILSPGSDASFTSGDVRRASVVHSLVEAGVPLDGLDAAMLSGQVSLDFLDAPAFERFSAYSGVTFAQLADRSAR